MSSSRYDDVPDFSDLELAAKEVIAYLKVSGFEDSDIAVIGGMAVWKYLPDYRTTQDVDFFINARGAPKTVKERLARMSPSKFVDQAGIFSFRTSSGRWIQIDMTPDYQSPYRPEDTETISDVRQGDLPYISITDLVVFKINSCGLRGPRNETKARQDALDAANLLDAYGPLSLSDDQKRVVRYGIEDVVKATSTRTSWWERKLGL
ncbi:hypothetical protein ABW19_dt0203456 [Dactylella cylindrospora]|nr:hypothetical protein ABW19_dt0203456 [Dactylella cylindrospora]